MSYKMSPIFMSGDAVFYNGDKLRQELAGKKGWIHSSVLNEPNAFVVFFPDTKNQDSYILSADNLLKARPPKAEKSEGPEIMPRRRKISEDD